jgi:hypothetical protein
MDSWLWRYGEVVTAIGAGQGEARLGAMRLEKRYTFLSL